MRHKKTCIYCKKNYKALRVNSLYCSANCRITNWRELKTEKQMSAEWAGIVRAIKKESHNAFNSQFSKIAQNAFLMRYLKRISKNMGNAEERPRSRMTDKVT